MIKLFKEYFLKLYQNCEYAVTPYLHILIGHLVDLQRGLGVIIGYYQNSGMFSRIDTITHLLLLLC